MSRDAEGVTELNTLQDALAAAVSTLKAMGADGVRDVRLYASGCRDGRRTSDLRLEGGRMWLHPAAGPEVRDAGNSEQVDRMAMMLAELCFVASTWGWTLDELAGAAGCTESTLCHWLDCAGREEVISLPPEVERAIRRLLVVEHQRRLLGIADDDAPAWVLAPQSELDGLSIALLLSAGARHFHLVQRMLCAGSAPSDLRAETVH